MRSDRLKRALAFEISRHLRDRVTWVALSIFVLVLVIGAVDYWNSLPPRPTGSRLFGEAYIVALALAFHVSVAQDRASHFDAFLARNLLPARVIYVAKVGAAVLLLVMLAVSAFVLAVITSLGDWEFAARNTGVLFAGSLVLLPVVVLFELAMNTRYTVPLILALFFALMAVLNRTGDLPAFLHWLGFDLELTAVRATIRSCVMLALTVALFPLYGSRLRILR